MLVASDIDCDTVGKNADVAGTVIVKLLVVEPIVVLPDFVVTVTVAVADVDVLPIALHHVAGIVNATPDDTVLL